MSEGLQVSKRAPTEGWGLNAIVLDACSTRRGNGFPGDPGRVSVSGGSTYTYDEEDGEVIYDVTQTASFFDSDDDLIAEVEVQFFANYDVRARDGDLSDADIERFTPTAILQVVPFARELIASLTNRMGLPPFFIPIIRRPELEASAQLPTD